jgi:hypothetical protein
LHADRRGDRGSVLLRRRLDPHCDALGSYSGFEAASGSGGRTDEEKYLRGAQVTNSDGIVEFVTVYPGWYQGRTVHIHGKVHGLLLDLSRDGDGYLGAISLDVKAA